RILEEDGVVSRRERAVLGWMDDARLAELVDQETMDGVDVLAAPGAKAEVVQPGTLLVESAAVRVRRCAADEDTGAAADAVHDVVGSDERLHSDEPTELIPEGDAGGR